MKIKDVIDRPIKLSIAKWDFIKDIEFNKDTELALSRIRGFGRKTVNCIMKELKEHSIMSTERVNNSKVKQGKYIYKIFKHCSSSVSPGYQTKLVPVGEVNANNSTSACVIAFNSWGKLLKSGESYLAWNHRQFKGYN